ncbi:MAG: mechanosensitive ion channel family protein [Gammaproteobacteria bacterium]|nr:mechanosensitive ion channel family protein [Gammaproteobacteria bacterium]
MLLAALCAGTPLQAAEPAKPDAQPKPVFEERKVEAELRRLHRKLDDDELSQAEMQTKAAELTRYLELASGCEAQAKQDLSGINAAVATLPPDAAGDTSELKKRRAELNTELKKLTARASTCALFQLNIRQAAERLGAARKRAEEAVYLQREVPLWTLLFGKRSAEPLPAEGPAHTPSVPGWQERSRPLWQAPPFDGGWLWTSLFLSLGLGLSLRFRFRPAPVEATRSFSRRFVNAVLRSAFFHAPLMLLIASALAYAKAGYLGDGELYWAKVLRMAGLGALILVVLESLTLSIGAEEGVRPMLRRLRWSLRALYAAAVPWYAFGLLAQMAARLEPAVVLDLPFRLTGFLTLVTAVATGFSAYYASRVSSLAVLRWGWRLLLAGSVVVFFCDVAGYRVLARALLNAEMLSIGVLGGVRLALSLAGDFFRALDGGNYPWQQRLRAKLGLAEDEAIPGVLALHVVLIALLWAGGGIALLRIWGLSDEGFRKLLDALSEGFTLGELKIVPENILLGVLLFAVLLTAFRWLRERMQGEWVRESKVSKGAREAIATIFWYGGVAVAAVAGLSLAGIDLSNLAVIAGALSVGIGFGLQNVVSNFISGLILLLERPIRPGDLVVVGGTEGFVQKISIRSTRIKTADRADVIVPNSEFITGQVINRVLQDTFGRIVLPIGVAYGSDVEKVRDLLLDIVCKHPDVVRNDPALPPARVLFRGFGDSALNFEVRAVIRNVEEARLVESDINYAIDKAFRENGISIPFPQRELHIRYPDGVPQFFQSPVPGVPMDKLNDEL